MKIVTMAAVAALALAATPAFANDFVGPRIEVTAGADSVVNGIDGTAINYGVGVGIDAPVGNNLIVGVEANIDNVFDRRNLGVSARVGVKASENVLVYGKVGYADWKQTTTKSLNGLRVGGGVEYHIGASPFYGKLEYRYSDFDGKIGQHGAVAGVGLRF